jgi:hypothetical protein
VEEFVDGAVVGVAGGAELARLVGEGFGEFAESVSEQAVVRADEEQRALVSGGGDLVAVGVRDAFDEAVVS